jgi:putative cell wall-binding protein
MLAIGGALVLTAAAGFLPGATAFAGGGGGDIGPTVSLNSSGGNTTSDGLRVYYGDGQIQVERDGVGQVYDNGDFPDPTTTDELNNAIILRVGTTIVGPSGLDDDAGGQMTDTADWDSITTSGGSVSGAGTILSTLTWTDQVTGLVYSVDMTLTYDGESDFYHEQAVVNVPTGNTKIVKLYRGIDTLLGGNDAGPGFYRSAGPIVGVISADDTLVEAFRYTAGPTWTGYWSGYYYCLFGNDGSCPGGHGFSNYGLDYPSTPSTAINSDPTTDNGMGIEWDLALADGGVDNAVAPAGSTTMNYDLIFSTDTALAGTAQTITFPDPADITADQSPVTLTATADSGLPVTYSSESPTICSVSGTSVTVLQAGTCTIAADQAGSSTYAPAVEVSESFDIDEPLGDGPQTITFPQVDNVTLGSSPITLTATADSTLDVQYSVSVLDDTVCSVEGNVVTILSPGECDVTAYQPGGGAYAAAANVPMNFTIYQMGQDVTFPAPPSTSISSDTVTLAATASSGYAVSYSSETDEVCTVVDSVVTLVGVGTCTIDADQDGDALYQSAETSSRSFQVTAAVVVVAPPVVTPPVVVPAVFNQIGGADRDSTAAMLATAAYPTAGSAAVVVLARDDLYADGLTGSPLADALKGPLLLTPSDSLSPQTQAAIAAVLAPGGTVICLGGESALSPSVVTALTALGYQVVRISGADRYATATAIADKIASVETVTHVYLATGLNFADALPAADAAGLSTGVVLLTANATMPSTSSTWLGMHTAAAVTAVGGQAAAADTSATPIVGADRYATAALVAAAVAPLATGIVLATGTDFPDGLSGAAYAAHYGFSLLLVNPQAASLNTAQSSYLTGATATVTGVTAVGGTTSLPTASTALITGGLN